LSLRWPTDARICLMSGCPQAVGELIYKPAF
jgi:hypothetical protein